MNAHRRLMAMAVTTCAADLSPAGYKGTITAVPNSPRCLLWVLPPPRQRAQQHRQLLHDQAEPPGEAGCAVPTGP
jgi:hypothetical protein